MSSSTYFNTGKLFSPAPFHVADLDKASLNKFQRARDDNNNFDNRNRVAENRRQNQFHNAHGELTQRSFQ